MSAFLELTHEGKPLLVAVSNIALIEQPNANQTKIHLLTQVNGQQQSYTLPVLYGELHYKLFNTESGLLYAAPINTVK